MLLKVVERVNKSQRCEYMGCVYGIHKWFVSLGCKEHKGGKIRDTIKTEKVCWLGPDILLRGKATQEWFLPYSGAFWMWQSIRSQNHPGKP